MQEPFKKHTYLLIPIFLAIIVYSGLIHNSWILLDDMELVVLNKDVHEFNWINLLTTPKANNFIPFTNLFLGIEYQLFGPSPIGLHLTSLFLHLINIVLVYFLLQRLSFFNKTLNILLTTLFAIHPVHVETISWIAAQGDLWAMMFLILSLSSYLNYKDTFLKKNYWLSWLLFTLSFGFQGRALAFPFVLLLLDYLRENKWNKKLWVEKLPFLLVSIGFAIIYWNTRKVGWQVSNSNSLSFETLLNPILYFGSYFKLILYPFHLNFFHTRADLFYRLYEWGITIPVVLYCIFKAIKNFKKSGIGVWAFLTFFLTLSPILKVIPFDKQGVIAERYLYIPLIFALIFLIVPFKNKKFFPFILGAICLVFSFKAFNQVKSWKNTESLYEQSNKAFPENPHISVLYAERLIYLRNYEKAKSLLEQTIMSNPNFGKSYIGLATLALFQRDFESLRKYASQAIKMEPSLFQGPQLLGAYYLEKKDFKRALEFNLIATRIAPLFFEPFREVGRVYYQMKNFKVAKEWIQKALTRNPSDYLSYNLLAAVELEQGNIDAAINNLKIAIKINPEYSVSLENLKKIRNLQKR